MNKITTVVLTHNDEGRIVDCLENLDFSEELIIIDDQSSDRTLEICKQYTNKIYTRSLAGNFASQRNYALNFASNSWVLFIDSDELVDEKLKKEILLTIKQENYSGYYIRRIDKMWGRKILHGEVGQVKLLRLAKKGSGKWHGKVHETWNVSGSKRELNSPLIHVPHRNVSEFLTDIEQYSSLRAEELAEKGVKTNFFEILMYPLAKFFKNYFFNQGYKDGVAGFVYAMMMSFHSFLVRGKLYTARKK